ncbi:hypothetical protein GRI34_05255 [Erythrobacter aquimaris]|uniref:Uncharacterized protein n=1 Tax=Qipengyuania aquimaris TaxID=255984 RepID=A0A6I4TMQ9_9SPHN|nr:hypothetical protein [Qipengyuania aquimaris]MXO95828.1 hypothetical protein [Qipengyuania aquimaris]
MLNWFCSVGLVLLITALSATISWFKTLPEKVAEGSFDPWFASGLMGETILTFVFYLPIILSWHLFDFVEKKSSDRRFLKTLNRYPTLLLTMSASAFIYLAMGLGVGRYNSCDELNGAYFHSCYVGPAMWIMLPWLIVTGLAFLLSILKAAMSISSHITIPR